MLIAMHGARVGVTPLLVPVAPFQTHRRRQTLRVCTIAAKADDTPSRSSTDLDAQLLQDLERLKAKEASQRAQQPAVEASTDGSSGGSLAGAKEFIDKLAWESGQPSAPRCGRYQTCSTEEIILKRVTSAQTLLDAWFPLWDLVFQPAIGVLMLGAIVSGTVGWLKNR